MLTSAIVIILLVGLGSIAFGIRYLSAKEYMSYHVQLTQYPWIRIPARLQQVILGMLKIVAAGLITFGIALAWLTIPLHNGQRWASWAILSLAGVNGLISIYVTITLRRLEPTAKTNAASAVSGLVLVLVALLMAKYA
jgi:hypothetical protein